MRWGIVVLSCPLPLRDEERHSLMVAAASAYFAEERETHLDWPELRGTLKALPETVALGGFTGQLFEAEVHTPAGEGQLRFLVAESELELMQGGPVAEA